MIHAIAKHKGLTPHDLEQIRRKKHDERGGFDEKILLVEVERKP